MQGRRGSALTTFSLKLSDEPPFAHYLEVVELGAGCALPSLLMSTSAQPPSLVVVTDYPDDVIMKNLKENVNRNRSHVSYGCITCCQGYEWGTDAHSLL